MAKSSPVCEDLGIIKRSPITSYVVIVGTRWAHRKLVASGDDQKVKRFLPPAIGKSFAVEAIL
jgi:hypothetical protein